MLEHGKLTAKNTTPFTITVVQPTSLLRSSDVQNFQKRSNTELWMPKRVTMCSVRFARTSRMGQIAIVKSATRMTGASDVMALEAFGFLASQAASGGMN